MGEYDEGIIGDLEASVSILRPLHQPESLDGLLKSVRSLHSVHTPQDLKCVDVVDANIGELPYRR